MARNTPPVIDEVEEIEEIDETDEAEDNAKVWTPTELAARIGIDPKRLRSYLRQTYPRPLEMKNSSWHLTQEVADDVIEHFSARKAKALEASTTTETDTNEVEPVTDDELEELLEEDEES